MTSPKRARDCPETYERSNSSLTMRILQRLEDDREARKARKAKPPVTLPKLKFLDN